MTVNRDDYNQALNAAYFFLKFRLRTKKEMIDYLYKKSIKHKWTEELIAEVITKLEAQDYINDKKFIEAFVDSRTRNKPKSQFVLTIELLRLGISKDLIDDYFSKNPADNEQLAVSALEKKYHLFKKLPYLKRKEKATRYLINRGFSFDDIRKAIDHLLGKE